MRKTFLTAILLLAAFSATMQAAVIWDLTPFTGDPIGVNVVVEDDVAENTLKITATVTASGANTIGDLQALFFNIDGGSVGVTEDMFSATLTGLKNGTFDSSEDVCIGSNITTCGGANNNLNGGGAPGIFPAGSFHIGLSIGGNGIGGDDIQVATILFNYGALGLTPEDIGPFAARVTSVGTDTGDEDDRKGSSKLFDGVPTIPDTPGDETQVPEPSTLLMLGAGLGLVTLAKLRRRA